MYSQEQSKFNNSLIEEHAPLVKKIAYHFHRNLQSDHYIKSTHSSK